MYFYTLCFSLGDPKSNCYLYMLMMMVHTLTVMGTFKPSEDKFFVITDEATGAVINKLGILRDVEVVPAPKPKTVYDMMKWKYMLPRYIDCYNQTVLYLDVDFLALKPFRPVLPADTMAVAVEGSATDSNYCAAGKLQAPWGVTAGFFGYNFGPTVKKVFDHILQRMDADPERYYTLDQPHFNIAYTHAKFQTIPQHMISFNGHGGLQTAFFINLAGEPGDGPFHYLKMLEIYMRLGYPGVLSHNSHSRPAPSQ